MKIQNSMIFNQENKTPRANIASKQRPSSRLNKKGNKLFPTPIKIFFVPQTIQQNFGLILPKSN